MSSDTSNGKLKHVKGKSKVDDTGDVPLDEDSDDDDGYDVHMFDFTKIEAKVREKRFAGWGNWGSTLGIGLDGLGVDALGTKTCVLIWVCKLFFKFIC